MIGEQDLDAMPLQIGHGHVVYTGGATGTDDLVERMAKQFGMQVEVLVPPIILEPSSSRRPPWKSSCWPTRIFTKRLRNWGNGCLVIFTRFNCCNAIIKLPKKRTPSMRLASWKRMADA